MLYRVDCDEATPTLLVQSPGLPDWSGLPADYVIADGLEPGLAVRYFEPQLTGGQALAFRLRANPTHRRRGRRRAWLTGDEQRAWLGRKGAAAGFTIRRVVCRAEGLTLLSKRSHLPALQLNSVLFEGVLEVTEPQRCERAVADGLGSGKAFGFGLLSLAPL